MRRWLVLWTPPPHQNYTIEPTHPPGHGCDLCTTYRDTVTLSRHFTRRRAERRAARHNDGYTTGIIWVSAG